MEDDDRESNASSENERDEVMEDAAEDAEADDNDDAPDGDDEEDNDHENEDEEDEENDNENDNDEPSASQEKTGTPASKDDATTATTTTAATTTTITTTTTAAAAAAAVTAADTATEDAPATADADPRATGDKQASNPDNDKVAGKAAEVREKTPAQPIKPGWRPVLDPRRVSARLYDIIPTMAAPQATSINAFAATPDQRFWITGGSDGYVRKYDAQGTINGKQLLTVAQRHPFVDSVVKAGILMSYWENDEVPGATGSGGASAAAAAASGPATNSILSGGAGLGLGPAPSEHVLSPVYSVAVQAQGLWVLSGTEGGGINLSSGRHEEGKRIACLHQHSSAVSVLSLLPDEKTVLSGSWDKTILDWDLNTGQVRRKFEASGSQISAIELRPLCGAPIPSLGALSLEDEGSANGAVRGAYSTTISSNNDAKFRNASLSNGANGPVNGAGTGSGGGGGTGDNGVGSGFAQSASPAHESLFGSPAGSLFGDDTLGGNGNVFGDDDDDEYNSQAMDIQMNGGEAGQSNGEGAASANGEDVTMGGTATDLSGGESTTTGAAAAAPAASAASDSLPSTGNATQATDNAGDLASNAGQTATVATGGDSSLDNQPKSTSSPATEMAQKGQQGASQPLATAVKEEDATEKERHGGSDKPTVVLSSAPAPADATQMSDQVFLSASIDGTLRIWDRRVQAPVARIGTRPGVPPWCMGACWSPDGNWIYAGRRNGTVEEYNIHNARASWQPERSLKLPAGSGAVSAVRAMPNGRHLVVASHDILRLYDLRDTSAFKNSSVPFLIVPGPPRAGVIAQLYLDPSARFMVSIAGTRGWDGTCTECLVGYEINVVD